MEICVFCSSSDFIDSSFYDEAEQMGSLISHYKHNLVFGGARMGLMGVLAGKVKDGTSKVTGVIPEIIYSPETAFHDADELIITKSMKDRKKTMTIMSDAFIALPGGFGTLEEIMEVITQRQLRVHDKPIVLVNTNGYFNTLNAFFNHMFGERFASENFRRTFHFVSSSMEAMDYLHNFHHPETAGAN